MSPVKDRTESASTDEADDKRNRLLTVSELAFYVGVSPQTIREMIESELISPHIVEQEPFFHTDILPVVRRILRIHRAMGVNVSDLPLIFDLLDRVEKLEEQLIRLTRER
jgi:DNA-binding transcriptional MerR regulator